MLKTRIKNLDIFFCMRAVKNQKNRQFFGEGGIREKVSLEKKLSFVIPFPLMRLSFINKNFICIFCIMLEGSNST